VRIQASAVRSLANENRGSGSSPFPYTAAGQRRSTTARPPVQLTHGSPANAAHPRLASQPDSAAHASARAAAASNHSSFATAYSVLVVRRAASERFIAA
jgi:hypothetical protein